MLDRSRFPALDSPVVFLDNAGGSQLPRCVIAAINSALVNAFAQVGGDYTPSAQAASNIRRAHDVVKAFLNVFKSEATDPPQPGPATTHGEVILGPSSTALCHLIANAYADARDAALRTGETQSPAATRDEIIVSMAGHEANIGPWMRLISRGWRITPWPTEPDHDGNPRPRIETLRKLLSTRTRLVAFPQVSNILGEVWDARAVADAARSVGARSFIDGVAYAPHHAPDVRAIGCDWYVFSTYKVFGPHMGALFGAHDALAELTGPNHEFIPRTELPKKFEVGGVPHEGAAAIAALWDHARDVADSHSDPKIESRAARELFERAFDLMAARERELQRPVIDYITSHPRVRLVGPATAAESRVATISFVHDTIPSGRIARDANAQGLGIRHGHFYSRRLLEELRLPPVGGVNDGVTRVSLLYYNNPDEIASLLRFFDRVL